MRRSDRELEELLARGVARSCPKLPELPGEPEEGSCYEALLPLEFPRRRRPLRGLLAACLVLALLGGGAWGWFSPVARVRLTVNPCLELTTNRLDRVLEVEPLNRDAEVLLEGLKLENMELDTAVSVIVGAMAGSGYLDQDGMVSISVTADSVRRADALEQRIAGQVTGLLPEVNVQTGPVSVLPSDDEEELEDPDDLDDDDDPDDLDDDDDDPDDLDDADDDPDGLDDADDDPDDLDDADDDLDDRDDEIDDPDDADGDLDDADDWDDD